MRKDQLDGWPKENEGVHLSLGDVEWRAEGIIETERP